MKTKTAEEIIKEMIDVMPFQLSENIIPYIKEAMEIYRSQASELPSDEIEAECDRIEAEFNLASSPLLASKDARIKELEELLEECGAYHQGYHSEIGNKIRKALTPNP